jgi:predicted Ser/Thr protein kinase
MARPDHGGELLSTGNQGVVYKIQPDSALLDDPGVDSCAHDEKFLVVKQVMGSPLSRKLRRLMLRREYDIYRSLEGITGIPRCFGLTTNNQLLLEYIDGRPLRLSQNELRDRDLFFSALRDLIFAMHRAGVAHMDLKRKENILVTSDGLPALIDFGSAVKLKQEAGALNRRIFELACRIDFNAWVKHKYLGRYGDISLEDEQFFRPTLVERLARIVRRIWRKLTGRQRRKARRQLHR